MQKRTAWEGPFHNLLCKIIETHERQSTKYGVVHFSCFRFNWGWELTSPSREYAEAYIGKSNNQAAQKRARAITTGKTEALSANDRAMPIKRAAPEAVKRLDLMM